MRRWLTVCLAWGAGVFLHPAFAATENNDRELLVYYVNETSLTNAALDNTHQIESWLDNLATPKAIETAASLRSDETKLSAVTQKEAAELLSAPVNVLIFNNRLARDRHFLAHLAGDSSTNAQVMSFSDLPPTDDIIYRNLPLSSSNGLAAALSQTRHFVKEHHVVQVGLIFKSHGSTAMALTPRVAFWHSEISPSDLAGLLETNASSHPMRGTPREMFPAEINTFQSELNFPVAFVLQEACFTDPMSLRERLSPEIRRVFTANTEKVPYENLNYAPLIQNAKAGNGSFLENFIAQLTGHPKLIELRAKRWWEPFVANWYYFTPLALLLAWLPLWYFRQRR